ncbi:unnamed protein product [Discula destructiva]
MTDKIDQYTENQIHTVQSLATAIFNRKFSKLKHVDKKAILAVLECCVSEYHLLEELENLTVAAAYPRIALDCNRIRLTLAAISNLTYTAGPSALSSFSGIAPNSVLEDPLSAILSLQSDLSRWRYSSHMSLAMAWEYWFDVEITPSEEREAAREACKVLQRQFSEMWEVVGRLEDQSRQAALLSGVEQIHCVANVASSARGVLRLIAERLQKIEADRERIEKPDQAFEVIVPNDPMGNINPFESRIMPVMPPHKHTWLGLKARLRSIKRETIIWNQNLQYQANWLALLVLLVINPVFWILLAALPFTVRSTLLCGMPDSAPAIDSDFFAGLSSTVSGFAGLYAIISSLWRPDPLDAKRRKKFTIDSKFPTTFKVLLGVSVLTGVASVAVYPWESPLSIPLAFVSNVAQNIATLLIVQGSTQKITELER